MTYKKVYYTLIQSIGVGCLSAMDLIHTKHKKSARLVMNVAMQYFYYLMTSTSETTKVTKLHSKQTYICIINNKSKKQFNMKGWISLQQNAFLLIQKLTILH